MLKKDDNYFMKEALKQAQIGYVEGEIPVGAIVVSSKKVIARAHNQTEKLTDSTAHAEMLAITSAFNYLNSKYLQECTLYVTLEPCTMCGGAIFWSQMERLVYGASDPKRGFSMYKRSILHPKTKLKSGILQKECKALLDRFFSNIRN